jgi:signal transduction histidine kinase
VEDSARAGGYVLCVRPPATRDALLDASASLLVIAIATWDVWSTRAIFGTQIAGPKWLTAVLPLLFGAPLLWRRRYPLLTLTLITTAFVAQALASRDSAEGVELLIPWALGLYAVAAFAVRRRALVGLAVFTAGYAIYALEDRNVRVGGNDQRWSAAFWGLCAFAAWLIGFLVRSRREGAAAAADAESIKRTAEAALLEERSRIARELHDVIAHTVSVIGLQAGAAERMLDRDPERAREPLQSIQACARESVLELRRLLGILREHADLTELAPQPRLASLGQLVEQVAAAGLEVDLRIEGEAAPMSPGIELSAYRIVQEALTNVLKHADATRAEVIVRHLDGSLELEVSDNGRMAATNGIGHGLIGMRERATLYGGTVAASLTPKGGFLVRAQLPHDDRPS